jgi:ketosteroid isomerase-like protein
MSNLSMIEAHYAASAAGDLEGMLAPLAPDAQWTEMEGFPCAGTYTGPDEVKENVFFVLGSEWDGYKHDLDELFDAGDVIVATGTYSGTYKATGQSFSCRVVHLWRLENEKVVAFEQFTDTLKVAEAMR